jgi:hypothetical protein
MLIYPSKFHNRVLTEYKFNFDGNEVKLLGKQGKTRDYGNPEFFGGTVDWMYATESRVYVADYKTGKEKDPCCAQMKVLSGFAFEVFGLPVTSMIVSIPISKFPARTRAKWYSHRTEHQVIPHKYDFEGSASCAAYMRAIYSRVQTERANRKADLPLTLVKDAAAQCKYCNSKKFCKEWLGDEIPCPT